MNDNTKYVEMVNPNGNRVLIPCSPRHNGNASASPEAAVLKYKAKGFLTVPEWEQKQELERLRTDASSKRGR